MSYKKFRIIEPIVMRLKYEQFKDILKKELANCNIDYIGEVNKENPQIILEVYNHTLINEYLYKWFVLIANIPGMRKTYADELDLIEGIYFVEAGYIECKENDIYTLISILPIDIQYNFEAGTTKYLLKLDKHY